MGYVGHMHDFTRRVFDLPLTRVRLIDSLVEAIALQPSKYTARIYCVLLP